MSNMQRIESDLTTGEQKVVDFTEAEIEEIQAATILSVRFPNWDILYNRLLAGNLKPLFLALKAAAKASPEIAVDYFQLTTVLSSIRAEQALQDCLIELITDGYVLSDEHRTLWNNAIAELNFSDLVKL
ncbi:MAG: hypothetical protein ACK52I_25125 [Pseudomonadota bacterium]|jgi:hypothetical protein|nr:hypothetical protein [Pseudanabaena sp. M090S1SP2A07QC]MCA6508746.1 hypothetical protein [Pseudanabaena sp. M109S1SP2A07QC]